MNALTDPLQQAFEQESRSLVLSRAKLSSLIGIILFPIFGFLDLVIFPEQFSLFIKLRVLLAGFLTLILLLLRHKDFGAKFTNILGMAVYLSVGLTILYMIHATGGYLSTYYAGINFVVLVMVLIMPWGLKEASIACAIFYALYLVPILMWQHIERIEVFVNNNYFLVSTILIALLASFLGQKLRYREFCSRFNLESARKQLEESVQKLKELDSLKSQFFSNVSHELRTPLTLILAPLESFLKGEMGQLAGVHQRHVEMMHQNGLRLLKQINSLLDLAKLDAGRMELCHRQGNPSMFFKGLVASIAPMADKKQITFIGQERTPLPPAMFFDQDRLEKVVLNLVFNALKFTNPGGRVDLMWGASEAKELWVQVKDTGIGIAPEHLPKLFKRFSQVESSINRRYEGTGIGLALAKEIVELHEGRIEVESEPGRGTTMTVTIPLILEDPGSREKPPSDASPSGEVDWTRQLHIAAEHQLAGASDTAAELSAQGLSPSNGVQVLVVEDNHDMQEFIAFQLQGEYRVLRAANGVEGIRLASEALPDLIVSDVMMPEKDGYQLCREIRTDPRTMHIPIVLLTARADMAMKIEGLEHGADDYLTKPFNAQELRAKIKSLLALRGLEREVQQRNEALEAALAELKATQSQLVQSEKMAGLGLLVAGMAHEINNPINFAKNSVAIVERAWRELKPLLDRTAASRETVEDLEASVGIVKTGVERTEQIVTQLKVFARKDQNRRVPCSVNEGLESTLHLIRPTLGRHVEVHTDLQSAAVVNAVPGQLNQVWMNLLQNAAQAVGASGEIWVASRDREHVVEVSVRDSGPGIEAEHLSKLFEPFFTTKPVGQGTGLGLSVSYQVIQEAGGRIEVTSDEGRGAEFTVVLPLAPALSRAA